MRGINFIRAIIEKFGLEGIPLDEDVWIEFKKEINTGTK